MECCIKRKKIDTGNIAAYPFAFSIIKIFVCFKISTAIPAVIGPIRAPTPWLSADNEAPAPCEVSFGTNPIKIEKGSVIKMTAEKAMGNISIMK